MEQQGFEILQLNYRCFLGEIDIIAKDGQYLVFCEVKYRENQTKGGSLAAVNKKKQRKLYQCASHYIMVNSIKETACRFDVIGIDRNRVMHIKDAFQVS